MKSRTAIQGTSRGRTSGAGQRGGGEAEVEARGRASANKNGQVMRHPGPAVRTRRTRTNRPKAVARLLMDLPMRSADPARASRRRPASRTEDLTSRTSPHPCPLSAHDTSPPPDSVIGTFPLFHRYSCYSTTAVSSLYSSTSRSSHLGLSCPRCDDYFILAGNDDRSHSGMIDSP